MSMQRLVQSIARPTLILIALVQFVLGLIFVFAPRAFAEALGLPPAPAWTDWLLAMFGARALGFGFGMIVAQRNIARHASWLIGMLLVQAIDWIATLLALAQGKVTLAQVSTAPFLPVLFIAVLLLALLRRYGRAGAAA